MCLARDRNKHECFNNIEIADPDTSDSESEDAVPENDEKNNASKLGENIGDKPEWKIICPDKNAETVVMSAAHHCIPGNASFKKATNLLRFMRKGGPFNYTSDVGYGINHENNGVWLPGNYNVRPGKDHYEKGWGGFNDKFKNEYAKRAISQSYLQFHDARPDYNKKVLRTLKSIAK